MHPGTEMTPRPVRGLDAWLDRAGTLLGVAAILVLAAWIGAMEAGYVEFDPVNGHWQNYNSMARLMAGQRPFVDFPLYLGLASVLVPYPFFAALGGTLGASNAAFDLVCVAGLGFSAGMLLRLCRVRPALAWCMAACLTALPWPMERGNDSALGIRSALPFVAAGLVLLVLRMRRDGHMPRTCWALAGAACGLMPLWSNDYGLPTAAAFGLVLVVACWQELDVVGALVGLALACLAPVGVLWLATGGHPMAWVDFNFGSVLSDQFWFYNPVARGKVYGLADIPHDPVTILMVLPNAVVCLMWLQRPRDARMAALAMVCAAAVGGAFVSGLAGTFQFRYFMPLWRVSIVTLPYCCVMAARWGLAWMGQRSRAGVAEGMRPPDSGKLRSRVAGFCRALSSPPTVAVVCVYSVLLGGYVFWTAARDVYWHVAPPDSIWVPELGTRVRASYMPAIEAGRTLGQEYSRLGLPADKRLLSTYATATSYLSGSRQHGPDYIIHALGTRARQDFVDSLDSGYRNVETMDPLLLLWGGWNVRESWPFFRHLFVNWQPTSRTPWSLIWSPRPQPLPQGPALSCTVEHRAASGDAGDSPAAPGALVNPLVTLRVGVPAGGVAGVVEVVADLHTHFEPTYVPLVGGHRLVEVIAGYDGALRNVDQTSSAGQVSAIVSNTWTLPLRDGKVAMPLIVGTGQLPTLSLRAWPYLRAGLDIDGCTAVMVARLDQVTLPSVTQTGSSGLSGQAGHRIELAATGGVVDQPEPYPAQRNMRAIYLKTADPLSPLGVRRGDIVQFEDGRQGRVLLSDFWHIQVSWPGGPAFATQPDHVTVYPAGTDPAGQTPPVAP